MRDYLYRPFIIALVVLPHAFDLAGATVRFEAAGPDHAMQEVQAEIVVSSGSGDQDPLIRTITFDVPGSVELEMPPEASFIQMKSSTAWAPVSPVSQDGPTTVRVWRSSQMQGTLALADATGEELPKELNARITSAGGTDRGRKDSEFIATVTCEVEGAAWSCRLPAGLWNVRLRSPGFISQYHWDVNLSSSEATKLGRFSLTRGASLVGWVVAEGDDLTEEGILVTLASQELVASRGENERGRKMLARMTVRADAKGFFHFEGVPAGGYEVAASRAGAVSRRIPVRLLEGMEAELREVVRVQRPSLVRVQLSPAASPGGSPWRVVLEEDLPGNRQEILGSATADRSGEAVFKFVREGEYTLVVESRDGSRWLSQAVGVAANENDFSFELRSTRVHGTVLLGELPIAATLNFGGERYPIVGTLLSSSEGTFEGVIPTESIERSVVDVHSKFPPVRAEIGGLEWTWEEDGSAAVAIKLPSTRVIGEVVYADGRHADRAIVTVGGSSGLFIQTSVDASGTFHLEGLKPGVVKLSAEAPDGESDVVTFEISKDAAQEQQLTLTLQPFGTIKGRIVSKNQPVAGAALWPLSVGERSILSSAHATGVDGSFAITASADHREIVLAIFAPGFSFRTARVSNSGENRIPVSQQGGTLILELPAGETGFYLFDQYGYVPVGLLIRRLPVGFESIPGGLVRHVIAQVEPGPYTVCSGSPADVGAILNGARNSSCRGTFVTHLGTGTLRVE